MVSIAFVTLAQPLLPWGMAFAAGAMLFVATFGVIVGFVVMMFLDTTLG